MQINRQSRVDGFDIDYYKAIFSGAFDIDAYISESMTLDAYPVFLVSARASGADFSVNSDSGEVTRKNKLRVEDLILLEGEMRERAINHFRGAGSVEFPSGNEDAFRTAVESARAALVNGELSEAHDILTRMLGEETAPADHYAESVR